MNMFLEGKKAVSTANRVQVQVLEPLLRRRKQADPRT